MPWFGRDFDSRRSITSVTTWMVSPWKTGLGNRTSAEGEGGIDEALAVFRAFHIFLVQVQQRRVVRHRGEQHIVGFRHGPADRVVEDLPDAQLVIPNAGHQLSPRIEIAAMP